MKKGEDNTTINFLDPPRENHFARSLALAWPSLNIWVDWIMVAFNPR